MTLSRAHWRELARLLKRRIGLGDQRKRGLRLTQVSHPALISLIGTIFTAGMLAVDTANGLWVYRLIRSSEAWAVRWSRGLTFAIALLSLGLAVFGLARLADARLDGWYDTHALAAGVGCTLLLAAVWLAGRLQQPAVPA